MLHFTCDGCGQNVDRQHFVIKLEAFEACADNGITDDDLDEANLEAVAEILRDMDDGLPCTLPPKRRQIFILSRQQGLTYPEIAKQLNLSVKTVEAQIMQALKFLRTYFRAHGSEILSVLLLLGVSTN